MRLCLSDSFQPMAELSVELALALAWNGITGAEHSFSLKKVGLPMRSVCQLLNKFLQVG